MKMKDDKTEFVSIGTISKISQVTSNLSPISISRYEIPFSQSVKYWGFYSDKTLHGCAE